MKPSPLPKHKWSRGLHVERERMPGHPFQVSAGGQLEAVKMGLPPGSLISLAHIFLIAVTTLPGIGT
jgi:hypothetical protein